MVSTKFSLVGGMASFTMKHTGSSNFIVTLLQDGQTDSLLANEVGNYAGTAGMGVPGGMGVLEVKADGPWTVVIDQPRGNAAPVSLPASGKGRSLVGPVVLASGIKTITMMHAGKANFIVDAIDAQGKVSKLLANEIGAFNGSAALTAPAGSYYFDIQADGAWTLDLK